MATESFQTSRRAINYTQSPAFQASASCSLVSFLKLALVILFWARPPDEVGALDALCGDLRDTESLWRWRHCLRSFLKGNTHNAAAPCKEGNLVRTVIVGPQFSKHVMLIMQTGENSEISSSWVSCNGSIMQPTSTLYSNNVISHWLVDKHGPMLSVKQNCCARLYLGDKQESHSESVYVLIKASVSHHSFRCTIY